MSIRTAFRVVIASTILTLATAGDALGQLCIGTTAYVVRDTAGRVMSAEQMKGLAISVNGVPLRVRTSERFVDPYYGYDHVIRFRHGDSTVIWRAADVANPLSFDGVGSPLTLCGRIADMTLAYGGKVMRMALDVEQHNTYYEIDSPPFQDGSFHLGSLACGSGAPPPRIDNRTTGVCRVSADNWERMGGDRVRYFVPIYYGGGFVQLSADACRSRGTVVITTPEERAAVWKSHPEATGPHPEPSTDFGRQFLLVVYQAGRAANYGRNSFLVRSRGDLTFIPVPDERTDPGACSVMFFVLSRDGINSVEGKPLPPPAR